MANGWTGNILRVNLTTGNITLEDSSKFKKFVGGMGFGYKIMYDEVPAGTKPFDEGNKLVFATGPLTGSGAPCSSRVNITSLSTFTKGNLVVDAHMGGFFAAQMKFAGYDAIIIEGKDSPYANVLVIRAADKDTPMAKALIKAVNSPEVKAYIIKELEPRGIVPAF